MVNDRTAPLQFFFNWRGSPLLNFMVFVSIMGGAHE
jgi:hypothetical protein